MKQIIMLGSVLKGCLLNQLYRKGRLFSFFLLLAYTLSGQVVLAQVGDESEPSAENIGFPLVPLVVAPQPACQFNPDRPPEMVLLQGGHFLMGSVEGSGFAVSYEHPQHWVAIQPFALSRCEITVAQFRQFVQETDYVTTAEKPRQKEDSATEGQSGGTQETVIQENRGCLSLQAGGLGYNAKYHWRNPGFEQSEQQPATCISWYDANAYIQWLNVRTGFDYRLPTEAEWEYAARANYGGLFAFGDNADTEIMCEFANVDTGSQTTNCKDDFEFTAPVAQFQPNGFGLYDMHGNVWEWTADCWHNNYQNAPNDGSVWLAKNDGNCERRVVRGGSWLSGTQGARSASRIGNFQDGSNNNVGFRVARTL